MKGLLLKKETFEREGATSKIYYGKEAQGGKYYHKNKISPPQYPCPVDCGDKVSFGAASNCQNFRRMNKGKRKDRCKKYNLCRKCLKSLKRIKHLLICPEERREQKLHKVQDEDGYSDDQNDEDYCKDKDLFDPNLQFHFSHDSSGYDDGDDFQDDSQEEDEYGEDQDHAGDVPKDEVTDRKMFVKSLVVD